MSFMERVKYLLLTPKPLKPAIYHFRGGPETGNLRLHLRVEPGGNSILMINASRVLHLNQTATEYAKLILEGKDEGEIIKTILRRYKGVTKEQVAADYRKLRDTIKALSETGDICPISYLDVERIEPFQTPVSAPHRMDLALTYRCNLNCGHCYVEADRKGKAELSTGDWKRVLDNLWKIGIPHVCFTGGEPTLREDLVDLVEYAEDIGIVTGLLTNGVKLADNEFVQRLVEAGLDHFQITLESHDESIHNRMVGADSWRDTVQGIKNAVDTPVYTITNTTLTKLNTANIEQTVEFISSLGIEVMACNGIIYSGAAKEAGIGLRETELGGILGRIRNKTQQLGMRLIWYTPTRYCEFNPLQLELGAKQCTAGKFNMCIEPDGEVIPCQSYYSSVGNILRDKWKSIWNHPLLVELRERKFVMEKCKQCDQLPICGGGCPLSLKKEGVICTESMSNG